MTEKLQMRADSGVGVGARAARHQMGRVSVKAVRK